MSLISRLRRYINRQANRVVIKGVVNFAGVQSIFRNVCSTRLRAFFFQLDLFESCLASVSLVFFQRNIRIVKRVRVVVEVRC